MQRDDRLQTDDLRQFARALNRTWTNVVLDLYDDDEAASLLDELRAALPASSSGEEESS